MFINVNKDNGSLYFVYFFELCFIFKVILNSIICKDDRLYLILF